MVNIEIAENLFVLNFGIVIAFRFAILPSISVNKALMNGKAKESAPGKPLGFRRGGSALC